MKKPAKAAAQGAAAAKQAKAKLTGDHGVLDTLAKEHGEVSAMFLVVTADRKAGRHMKDEKVMERVRLLDDLVLELLSHAIAEEQHVYAVLENIPEARSQVRDSRSEHHEMEQLVQKLLTLEYSSPKWLETFDALHELVSHHVEEEESELFELAKTHLSKAQLKDMDEAFQKEKEIQRQKLGGRSFSLPRGS